MAPPEKTVGAQELSLLQYVTEHGPLSVRDVADGYGARAGLARSTVLTMLERLRKKGRLRRRRAGTVYQYSSPVSSGELMTGEVRSFVEKTLGGSVSPFVAYLAESEQVSDDDLAQLEELVAKLQTRRKEDEP
jgi:predicted transcriptional regulator